MARKRKAKKLNLKPILAIVVLAIVVGAGYVLLQGEETNYYDFTACMAQSGIIEIGSDSCLHCENQKRILGHDAFKTNFDDAGNYMRCNRDPVLCGELGIKGTPTWYMPSDTGKRIEATGSIFTISGTFDEYLGEQSIPELVEITGCLLPENYDASQTGEAGGFTGS